MQTSGNASPANSSDNIVKGEQKSLFSLQSTSLEVPTGSLFARGIISFVFSGGWRLLTKRPSSRQTIMDTLDTSDLEREDYNEDRRKDPKYASILTPEND